MILEYLVDGFNEAFAVARKRTIEGDRVPQYLYKTYHGYMVTNSSPAVKREDGILIGEIRPRGANQ